MLEITLSLLFRTDDTCKVALALLSEVRDKQTAEEPYTSEEYHEFCQKHKFSEQSYQNVPSKLREHDLLVESGGHHEGRLDINYAFVVKLTSELFAFLGSKYRGS